MDREGRGWRARGAGAPDHGRGSGGRLLCLHVAVDDRSRVAYAELLGDEREETCAAFMGRARDFYRGLGVEVERVMTDDGPGYRSRLFNEWLAASGIAHRYARPYSPWQNGKVERMNRKLAQERQYARLRQRGGEGRRPLPLHRPLQLGQAPQRLRRPPADVTHRRCKQRHGTQHLGTAAPILKPISGHTSCAGVYRYLTKNGRALARDFLNIDAPEEDGFD